jgi:hypothetical protein
MALGLVNPTPHASIPSQHKIATVGCRISKQRSTRQHAATVRANRNVVNAGNNAPAIQPWEAISLPRKPRTRTTRELAAPIFAWWARNAETVVRWECVTTMEGSKRMRATADLRRS